MWKKRQPEARARSLAFAIRETADMELHVFGSTFPNNRVLRLG